MSELKFLRTPAERFADLPDFDYPVAYLEPASFAPLRMAYVDTGPAAADVTFLCLHGEPTWGFLYRKMIPEFTARGCRVVVPDMFGFGRSDKPTADATYTFDFHRYSLLAFVTGLDLHNIVLVVQDWGGLLGLTLPMALHGRVTRALVMNTVLATGEGSPSEGFTRWRDYMATQPDPDVGAILSRAVADISPAEVAAYEAPFPDASYKGGVRRFPALVPTKPDMAGAAISRTARAWFQSEWTGDMFFAVGMQDPVLGPPVMERLRDDIAPGVALYPVAAGGHFVQEHGVEAARAACEHFRL